MKLRRFRARLFVVVCAVGLGLPPFTAAAPAVADEWSGPSVDGEYIVLLKPGASADAVAAAAQARQPAEVLEAGSTFVRLVLDPARSPADTLSALKNIPGVEDAQPNFVTAVTDYLGRIRFFTDLGPAAVHTADAGYSAFQPGLANSGMPTHSTANGVIVAVLDTGVDRSHPELANRIATGGYDFVSRDDAPDEARNGIDDNGNDVIDEAFGHGTYVAGIVAMAAPGAMILPVRVLDSDGSANVWRVMQGIAWASARGAKVINLSLGGPAWGPVAETQLRSVEAAGRIVVAAAGNDAAEQQVDPAAIDGVVGVTAINGRTAAAATFSNRGSWIDVAAPGVEVVSLYPGDRYATWGGTSAAAPVASAALALIAALQPTKPVDDLVGALTSTAQPSGVSGLSAYGRINLSAAVAKAASM